MPRGDGTGPWGTGPMGRGRGGCQPLEFSNRFGLGFCPSGFGRKRRQGGFGFASNNLISPDALETQAEQLESQAKLLESQANNLRNLANQNRHLE